MKMSGRNEAEHDRHGGREGKEMGSHEHTLTVPKEEGSRAQQNQNRGKGWLGCILLMSGHRCQCHFPHGQSQAAPQ